MMSDYTVEMINDGLNEFNVEFHGPKESTTLTLLCFKLYGKDSCSSMMQFPSCFNRYWILSVCAYKFAHIVH